MWDFAADVCDSHCGGFDEQMNWIKILGWILLLLSITPILVICFIKSWVGTLVGLGIAAMIAIGTFLIVFGDLWI